MGALAEIATSTQESTPTLTAELSVLPTLPVAATSFKPSLASPVISEELLYKAISPDSHSAFTISTTTVSASKTTNGAENSTVASNFSPDGDIIANSSDIEELDEVTDIDRPPSESDISIVPTISINNQANYFQEVDPTRPLPSPTAAPSPLIANAYTSDVTNTRYTIVTAALTTAESAGQSMPMPTLDIGTSESEANSAAFLWISQPASIMSTANALEESTQKSNVIGSQPIRILISDRTRTVEPYISPSSNSRSSSTVVLSSPRVQSRNTHDPIVDYDGMPALSTQNQLSTMTFSFDDAASDNTLRRHIANDSEIMPYSRSTGEVLVSTAHGRTNDGTANTPALALSHISMQNRPKTGHTSPILDSTRDAGNSASLSSHDITSNNANFAHSYSNTPAGSVAIPAFTTTRGAGISVIQAPADAPLDSAQSHLQTTASSIGANGTSASFTISSTAMPPEQWGRLQSDSSTISKITGRQSKPSITPKKGESENDEEELRTLAPLNIDKTGRMTAATDAMVGKTVEDAAGDLMHPNDQVTNGPVKNTEKDVTVIDQFSSRNDDLTIYSTASANSLARGTKNSAPNPNLRHAAGEPERNPNTVVSARLLSFSNPSATLAIKLLVDIPSTQETTPRGTYHKGSMTLIDYTTDPLPDGMSEGATPPTHESSAKVTALSGISASQQPAAASSGLQSIRQIPMTTMNENPIATSSPPAFLLSSIASLTSGGILNPTNGMGSTSSAFNYDREPTSHASDADESTFDTIGLQND